MYRIRVISILSVLSLIIFAIPVCSQHYHVQRYNTDNGLKSRIILSAAQDSSGFIWFATDIGVSRYDGYDFRNFSNKDNLPSVYYRKIYTDSCGTVWALPLLIYDTIHYYREGKWQEIPPIDNSLSPVPAEFTSIRVKYMNDKPVVLAGATNGLYSFDGVWRKIQLEPGKGYEFVRNIFLYSDGFYICTNGGLIRSDGNKTDYSLAPLSGGQPVFDGFPEKDRDGKVRIWLLETKRVGYLEDGKYYFFTDNFILPSISTMQYFAIAVTKKYIIFGNEWGKFIAGRETGQVKEIVKKNGFTTDGLTSLMVDREEDIWVTDTRGADKFGDLDIESYNSGNGLLESEVTGVAEFGNGKIVLSHNTGITLYDGRNFIKKDFITQKEYVYHSSRIQDLCIDNEDNIWIAASRMGLGKVMENGSVEWFRNDDRTSTNSVIYTKSGNILVMTSSGLCKFDNGALVKLYPQNKFGNSYRKVYEIGDDLYIIGLSGAFRIRNSEVKELAHPDKTLPPNLYTIFKDNKGRLLAGGLDGIFEIKGDSIIKSTAYEINSPVYVVKSDIHGDLWVGTNNGLISLKNDGTKKIFKRENGLAGDEINRSALMVSKTGDIWVGTEAGVSRIIDAYYQEIVPSVKFLYISDSKGQMYGTNEDISINNSDNSLSFVFRALSYVNEGLLSYRVKLEGFDDDWRIMTQDEIGSLKYNNLKPGDYKLFVSAKNEGSGWSGVYSTGIITIQRPVYLKWWFILLNLVFIFFVIWFIVNYRITKKYNTKLNREIEIKKIVEKALRESEERYRSVIEQTEEGVVLFDCETKMIIETNRSYERMLGYSKDEMKNKSLYDIVDDSQENINERFSRLSTDGALQISEIRHIMKNGGRIPVEVNITKIQYAGKAVICSLVRDITERKSNEARLKLSHEELEKAVAAKDKFFSILAHDLKSPFHGLLGYTELLTVSYQEYTDEERKDIIHDLHVVSRNLFQLVTNLLQWSQIQTGRIKVSPESFDVGEMIDTCCKTFKANAEQKELALVNSIQENKRVRADRMMADLIFRNLISNAVKFSNRRGRVIISSQTRGDREYISISDEGMGIPNEIIPKLFEITSKYTSRGTEDETGTGLGLVLCREMAEMNDGSISVESVWGKGSTFTVTLPINESPGV